MKTLNNIKFITESAKEIEKFKESIKKSESYADAKKVGNMAIGHINCMITYLNCMVDMENNDFTEQLDEQIDEWSASIYQAMAEKAISSGENAEIVIKCLNKRNEHRLTS